MASRLTMHRLARGLGLFAMVGVLSGCSLTGIKFTNVSDTWLNVSYYVGADDQQTPDSSKSTATLYRAKTMEVEPGASAIWWPNADLVHVYIETVSPTWKPTGQQYWLELLTRPPMHIVAAGVPEKLYFKSFEGEVAIIPKREQDGRYTYRSTRPTPTPPKPQSASASEQDPTVTDAMLSQDP